MCKYSCESLVPGVEGGILPPSLSPVSFFDGLIDKIKLVGYGVDTLVLNVRYAGDDLQPVQLPLDETLKEELDYLQGEAKHAEAPVITEWAFLGAPLFIEPHGAGRQWRWLLTCQWLSLVVSPGKFNDVIAQVRFSSEYLWSQPWTLEALFHVDEFLMRMFGTRIHLQVSSVDLCADVMGYDFSTANYEHDFVTCGRKQSIIYGPDMVNLDGRTPSYFRFSSSANPISCRIYNKTLEIQQKSQKTWFYDLWKKMQPGFYAAPWDGSSDVWRLEFHLKRDFLRNQVHAVTNQLDSIENPYDLLDRFGSLWMYAAGRVGGDADGLPDGWLRYVVPTEDSNRSRWPVHPAWTVLQSAFADRPASGLGPIVRKRIREKNLERGLAAMIGYSSTLAAWLGGKHADPDTDLSLVFQWLYEHGQEYMEERDRDFFAEVKRKQDMYNSKDIQ